MYKIFILLCAFSLLGIGLVKFVMDGYIDSNLEKLVVFNETGLKILPVA